MKFSLKTLAAAVVMAAAASSSFAAIDNGAGGNGELFLSVWNDNGSYTRDLGITINDFMGANTAGFSSSLLGTAGLLNLSFDADPIFTSYLNSVGAANVGSLKFSVLANDSLGTQRHLTTYSTVPAAGSMDGATATSALGNVTGYLNLVNESILENQSMIVNNGSAAWAGKEYFSDNMGGVSTFSNAGTLGGNNSVASGLSFMRLGVTTGNVVSYNPFSDTGAAPVKVWIDEANALHIAAVPEPGEYAMLLAGLGMLAAVSRRRNKRV